MANKPPRFLGAQRLMNYLARFGQPFIDWPIPNCNSFVKNNEDVHRMEINWKLGMCGCERGVEEAPPQKMHVPAHKTGRPWPEEPHLTFSWVLYTLMELCWRTLSLSSATLHTPWGHNDYFTLVYRRFLYV